MSVLIDDVGSFPLPLSVDREAFSRARGLARRAIAEGRTLGRNAPVERGFSKVVADSFEMKRISGLDIINYPQHYDMYRQFAEIIHEAMDRGTYLVDAKAAVIPEILVVKEAAKSIYEETGRRVRLRACITGPFELYLKEIGTTVHDDVLLTFAETVRRFAGNARLNTKYVKTEVVSVDEPSFGFQELSGSREVTLKALERAFDFKGVARQVHLHSSSKVMDLLEVGNLDVLALECAATPKSIECLTKRTLEKANKQVRVGISRTDIDTIIAEHHEIGNAKPSPSRLVESVRTMRKRLETAKERFGDCLALVGPDCGLGGWPSQEAAQLVLKRTVQAAKASH